MTPIPGRAMRRRSRPALGRHRPRGAALVVAMLVAAIAAAAATAMTVESMRRLASFEGRRDHARAVSLATAAIHWAAGVLAADAARGGIDHPGEPWAVPLPPTPVEGGSVEGRIIDAQSRINVNAIVAGDAAAIATQARLARLAAHRGVDPAFVDALADWIDADALPREHGAEDDAYAGERRLAANAPMVRAAELAFVRGAAAVAASRLADDLVALPADAALNVNTASAGILGAVAPELPAEALVVLAASRADRPFTSLDDFRTRMRAAGAEIDDPRGLAVSSRHFLVSVRARQGVASARSEALIARADNGAATIVWQIVE